MSKMFKTPHAWYKFRDTTHFFCFRRYSENVRQNPLTLGGTTPVEPSLVQMNFLSTWSLSNYLNWGRTKVSVRHGYLD